MAENVLTVCSRFHRAVELIGSRWTGAIIQTLLRGSARYALIRSAIPDITDRMLSERLRSLEGEGLLTRKVIPDSPVRVEYELTAKGRSLKEALEAIGSWAEQWVPLPGEQSARRGRTGTSKKQYRARKRARQT